MVQSRVAGIFLLPYRDYSLAFANSPCLVISSYMSSICFLYALAACGRLVFSLLSLSVPRQMRYKQVYIHIYIYLCRR